MICFASLLISRSLGIPAKNKLENEVIMVWNIRFRRTIGPSVSGELRPGISIEIVVVVVVKFFEGVIVRISLNKSKPLYTSRPCAYSS